MKSTRFRRWSHQKRFSSPPFFLLLFLFFLLIFLNHSRTNSSAEGGKPRVVEIRFGSETNGVPWKLTPERESLPTRPGEAVRGVFRLKSLASEQKTVLVRHKFEPPEMIRYLPTLECGLQFTITMDPGEEHVFESEFFLREGVPPHARSVRIVFTFELLDEPIGSKEIDQGRKLFVSRCATCHGVDGRGDTTLAKRFKAPPGDLGSSVTVKNDWQLLRFISEGKGMMPAFSPAVGENELRNVVHYLRSRWGRKG